MTPKSEELLTQARNQLRAGDFKEALTSLKEAARLNPSGPELLEALAQVHSSVGAHLLRAAQFELARQYYEALMVFGPSEAPSHIGLCQALKGLMDWQGLEAAANRALGLFPEQADLLILRSAALNRQGRFQEAIFPLEQALRLTPDHVVAHKNLGANLFALNRENEALKAFDRAIALKPDYGAAHLNKAITLLTAGRFREGFAEYDWRLGAPKASKLGTPRWDGGPIADKVLFVYAEQGLGDSIQFGRYLPLLKGRAKKIIFGCQKTLFPLLKASIDGVDEWLAEGEAVPEHDVNVALLSLPGLLDPDLQAIPAPVRIKPDADLSREWEGKIGGHAGLKVGLCWQGNLNNQPNRHRSASVGAFEPLKRMEGAAFFSLQTAEDWNSLPIPPDWIDPAISLSTRGFSQLAAAMAQLDLVITVDTSIAHLAASLGKPTWILLSSLSDWRWLKGRADSPWYPTVKLFRQGTFGDWDGPIQNILRAALPPPTVY